MKLHETYNVHGISVIVRREDKRYQAPLPPHGKMGVVDLLCKQANARGYNLIGCFGSKTSNWIAGVPIIAEKYKLNSIVCYPAKNMSGVPAWLSKQYKNLHSLIEEKTRNHQLYLLHPNMTTINTAQAKKRVESRNGFFIPFGFDLPICVDFMSGVFSDMPDSIGTLVVSCGSGITLAALLRAARKHKKSIKRIEAISSGRPVSSIIKTVSKHEKIPNITRWRDTYGYGDIPEVKTEWPCHSHYELKAYDWMARNIKKLPEPIYFVNVGRET